MGSSNHNRRHHQHQIISFFNPACCLRPPTIKKGTPRRSSDFDDYDSVCSSYSSGPMMMTAHEPLAHEPSSPKVGCMGQIKRGKASSALPAAHDKLYKLGRMLSGRNMQRSLRASSRVADDNSTPRVSVADLDPPLPVVKDASTDAEPVSLWKRRCGGRAILEGLQLQRQDHEGGWGVKQGPLRANNTTLVLGLS